MNILLVEPFYTGHHISLYLKNTIDILKEDHSIILLTSQEAYSSKAFLSIKDVTRDYNFSVTLLNKLHKTNSSNYINLLYLQLKWWFEIRRKFKEINKISRIDLVYVPSADFFIYSIALLGSPFKLTPFALLQLSPNKNIINENSEIYSKLKRFIFTSLHERVLNLKNLITLFVIDELFFAQAKNKTKLNYIPDYGEAFEKIEKKKARKILSLNLADYIILIYGSISRRKGFENLFNAINNIKIKARIKICLAGSTDEDFKIFLRDLKKTHNNFNQIVICRDFYHSDEDEALIFSASDLVWLGYDKHFLASSGVFYKAMAYEKLILGSRFGIIGDSIKKSGYGYACDPSNLDEVSFSLTSIINNEDNDSLLPNTKELKDKHSAYAHQKVLKGILEI